MTSKTVLDSGVEIEKKEDGDWVITSDISYEVVDKDNHEIPVDVMLKDVPSMMTHSPQVHLGHTDTQVGPVLDVWKSKKTVKENVDGKEVEKDVDGFRGTWTCPGDRRYLRRIQAGIENGEYGEISIKGYAYGMDNVVQKDGTYIKKPNDMEWINWALVRKGKNPLTGHVALEKGDDMDRELMKDEDFKSQLIRYMDDGMNYQKALETCKELYTDTLSKEQITYIEQGPADLIKEEQGENNMSDEIEGISKELEDLKKSDTVLQEKVDSLVKANEELSKERDDLKVELETMSKSGGESATGGSPKPETASDKKDSEGLGLVNKEDLEKMMADVANKAIEDYKKSIDPSELLKLLGLEKAADTPGLSVEKSEVMAPDGEAIVKAIAEYQNKNIGETKSYEDMEKEARGG